MNFYKNIIVAVLISGSIALVMGCGVSNTATSGPYGAGGGRSVGRTAGSTAQGSVSFQLFYDELNPYGRWVEYQNYGYVWIPDVDLEFSPYATDGHWVFTDDGWTWVSDYSWGWAAFHYGRWDYDEYYGWLWVPGDEWGPAWVTWRRSEGYYGWAPMGPGISIQVSFGSGYRVPNERWIFVSDRYIGRPDINRYYVDRSTNVTIINNSTVINNTYIDNSTHTTYVAGPPRDDVQKVTGMAITPVVIRENDKPGQRLDNNQLQIYRPRVQTGNSNDRKPVPTNVVNLKEVTPISERKPGNQRRDENQPATGKERSSQPPNSNPPGDKSSREQSRIVIPPDKRKIMEEQSQPQPAKPFENKERGQQPRMAIPPDRNKIIQEPPQTQSLKPSDHRVTGQETPVFNRPDTNTSIEEQPETQSLNPTENKRKGQQPPAFNLPDENKKGAQPLRMDNAKPFDYRGTVRQSRIFNPLDTIKNVNQQPKARNVRSFNKNGKVQVYQPPKPNKQEQDSTKHPSQIHQR